MLRVLLVVFLFPGVALAEAADPPSPTPVIFLTDNLEMVCTELELSRFRIERFGLVGSSGFSRMAACQLKVELHAGPRQLSY